MRHTVDRLHDLAHGGARQVDLLHPAGHARRRIVDQALDLARRLGAALGQRPDFPGHDGETPALRPGPRRLHRRVQGQHIGLERQAVDQPHDLGDTLRAACDVAHAGDHLRDRRSALARQLGGAGRLPAGLVGVLGGGAYRAGQLRHAGGGLLQRARLARRAAGHLHAAGGDLARTGVDLLHAMAYRFDRAGQPALHASHRRIQRADLVVAARRDRGGQVAIGDAVEMAAGLGQGPQHRAAKAQPDHDGQDGHQRQQGRRAQHHAFEHARGIGHGGAPLLPRIALEGIDRLDVALGRLRQRAFGQPVGLDAVPALERGMQRRQRLDRQRVVAGQHLVIQGRALRGHLGVGAQALLAGADLLQQRGRLRQGRVALLLQPAFHIRLGVGQHGAGLEQPAGRIAQVAGAFDIAAAQGFDGSLVVAQHRHARAGRRGEQQHEKCQRGRQRGRKPPPQFTQGARPDEHP
ncbi:hypothetical protein L571_2043 [Bordetella pertussis 2371640]|nr:hypothetical protein L571_2043 [Bordetella pertussis 2371640]